MKHIVAYLILSLVMNLTEAALPAAPKHVKRCHGASLFVR